MIRDGDWTLFDHDFALKRTVWARRNPDGSTTYRTDYAVDDTMEANKAMMAASSHSWSGDYHKIASIPVGILYGSGLARAHSEGDEAYVSRWLNDSDNAAWRTKGGRV